MTKITVISPKEVLVGDAPATGLVDAVRNNPDLAAAIHDAAVTWWLAHSAQEDETNAALHARAQAAEQDLAAKVELAQQSVTAATQRAAKAEQLQALHWQLSQSLMTGEAPAAVEVLRELQRLELIGQQASIAARLAALEAT